MRVILFICMSMLLTAQAIGSSSTGSPIDIDGDGEVRGLTDSILISRYLYDLRGLSLVDGVVGMDCTRCTVQEIEQYLYDLVHGYPGDEPDIPGDV